MRKQLTNHTRLLQNFQSRWRREYLTALREFHRITGSNNQHAKAGEVILIQDDGPRTRDRSQETMALFEQLMYKPVIGSHLQRSQVCIPWRFLHLL